jgi:hypothetical protein
MPLAKCGKCGLRTNYTPTGKNRFTLDMPRELSVVCPVVSERMKAKDRLSGDELDCEHLSRSASAAFSEWKRKVGL